MVTECSSAIGEYVLGAGLSKRLKGLLVTVRPFTFKYTSARCEAGRDLNRYGSVTEALEI